MIEEDKNNKNNSFLYILLGGVFVTIFVSFYSFYFKKDFDFFIETKCDPTLETCFLRDCVGYPDICPPNNLSYYNMYTIKAKDFKFCPEEDCTDTCKLGVINCVKTECTDSDINEGICVAPIVELEEPVLPETEI